MEKDPTRISRWRQVAMAMVKSSQHPGECLLSDKPKVSDYLWQTPCVPWVDGV